MERSVLRVLTCGSVDDGKSTLMGRLMVDGGMLADDHLAAMRPDDDGTLDYALLLDGLEAERAQQITIDVAWRYVTSSRRRFIIADAPGHAQYLRNMATAAAASDVAVLLVDATCGILAQTRRHVAILALLGVGEVILAVNKMDLVGYDEAVFAAITESFAADAAVAELRSISAIPLSARCGDNVVSSSAAMAWYRGPTLLEALETAAPSPLESLATNPGRMPIAWVDSSTAGRRRYAGSVSCGTLRPGDAVRVVPANSQSRIAAITTMDGELQAAGPGDAVMLELEDLVDAGPGDVICTGRPVLAATSCEARLIWLAETPPVAGADLLVKLGAGTVAGSVLRLDGANPNAPGILPARIGLRAPLAMTTARESRDLGRFLLIERASNATLALGVIDRVAPPAQDVIWQHSTIDRAARAQSKRQNPCIVWLTGLPAAGKSTIADRLEVLLHAGSHHTMALDGDNLRHGLCGDLGFSADDRAENIRRAGEVARLLLEAGLIVIASFVSPFRADRDLVRGLCPPGMFIEVFVNTPLAVCRDRDPKGLYRRAAAGTLKGLTGVDAPYEAPLAPELELRSGETDAETLAAMILDLLRERGFIAG
jgi:bifunctional enzyme CysN/CysC